MISVKVGIELGGVVIRSGEKLWEITKPQQYKIQALPVCEFSTENVNRSKLVADAHLMFSNDRWACFETRVFANQYPRFPWHIEEVKVALMKKKKPRFKALQSFPSLQACKAFHYFISFLVSCFSILKKFSRQKCNRKLFFLFSSPFGFHFLATTSFRW